MDLDPLAAGFDPARLERITAHLNSNYIEPGKIAGCQVLVSRLGQPAYFRSLGLMDRDRAKPMADDTIFRIYSMSKPITSVALMTLYEQGHFQLNDPVHRFIPEWRDQKVWVSGDVDAMELTMPESPMTMRHVLSHTAGLTYGATNHPVDKAYRRHGVNRDRSETLRTFIEKLALVPLRYQPGQSWMYSFATDVCGYLVEAISGKPFDQYLQETIFDPLGMGDTSFWVRPEKLPRFAANYQRQPDKSLKLIDDPERSTYLSNPSFFSGGGGLTSTTADYLRFCEMLRRGGELDGARILGPRTIDLMARNHLAGGKDLTQMAIGAFSETAYEGVGFGLGFAMTLDEVDAGSLGEGDYYWGGAASTIFWVDPLEDLVVIFMTQLMPSATFNFRGQLKNIIYSSIVE
ncbi:MAG: beta-lactamase family protein [Chloroflexi bacterium]|nr:beta-lactamase family protein [Chloroflexota bacterium]NJD65895.1 beta-lactamase family protein [Chloroflexota bacterium]PWB44943.1 MAG: serine hydrolase [Dehalococcoidia bacterium]